MDVYRMGAATLDGTRSSTYTFPSILSIDFSFFFLFMMCASYFPMNKSFPAWMMCDADRRGLLTSATCHVLLRTNPSGVLTDLSLCQSGLLPLEPFLPPFLPPSSLLPLGRSSAPFPRCHVPEPFGPFLPAPLLALYPFQAMTHTSSYDTSLLVSESFCVIFVSFVRSPDPSALVRRQPSSRSRRSPVSPQFRLIFSVPPGIPV